MTNLFIAAYMLLLIGAAWTTLHSKGSPRLRHILPLITSVLCLITEHPWAALIMMAWTDFLLLIDRDIDTY